METSIHASDPDGVPMTIWHERPHEAGASRMPLDGVMSSWLHVLRTEGTGGALTAAGTVQIVQAVSDYVTGLDADALAALADRAPGGFEVHVSRTEVTVPAAPGDADKLAARLAAVLAAPGNVMEDRS